MYVFVFMWTPSLSRGAPEFHDESSGIHGLIFAAFMIAVMFGSSFFGIFIKKVSRVEVISLLLLSIGVVSMAVPSVIDVRAKTKTRYIPF
jgi:MFS family permease